MGRLVATTGLLVLVALATWWIVGIPSPEPAAPPATDTPPAAPAAPTGLFEDVTAASGLAFRQRTPDGRMDDIIESIGSGAVAFDYDGDGLLDVYLLQSARAAAAPPATGGAPEPPPALGRLYRNLGGMAFRDVTQAAGLARAGAGFSAAAGDYDGDGHVDLFVFRAGPNQLYRNRGDGTFEDATATAGIAGTSCSVAGTLLDADGDGHLDLYVANYLTFDAGYKLHYAPDAFPGPLAFAAEADTLYRNRGDGTFVDVSTAAGIQGPLGRSMGVVAADFDGDGRADIFVANDASANFLYRNVGDGRFEEVGESAGLAYGFHGEATGAMAGTVGDYDVDGLPDIQVTDTRYGSLYRNEGGGRFRDRCFEAGIAAVSGQWVSWGGGFVDVDNDGDLDLLQINGDLHHPTGRPDLLFENVGAGRFEDISERGGPHFRRELLGRGGCIADFDNDGGMDVLITTIDGPPILLRGRPPQAHHWVTLALQGTRLTLGARVTVRAGTRTWLHTLHTPSGYLTQGDPRVHVGLGTAEQVDAVTVRWPGGAEESFRGLAADRFHTLVEGKGGP